MLHPLNHHNTKVAIKNNAIPNSASFEVMHFLECAGTVHWNSAFLTTGQQQTKLKHTIYLT